MESYNLEKMRELLADFYNLTKIKICIYDSFENELCYYPEKLSSFCSLLRSDKELDRRCQSCDKKAFAECRRSKKQYFYTCHAGLLECVSPILLDKDIIGYIFIGQVKPDDRDFFLKISASLPEALKAPLEKSLDELPDVPVDKIKSAIRIIDACTGYEYLKALVSSREKKIDVLLARYIRDNLEGDLTVSRLASHFHLSHNEIYSVFKEYFNSTPAEYIKEERLSRACALLCEEDMRVSDIAKACGIPDYNYFSKIFKKSLGTSPREYRRAHK